MNGVNNHFGGIFGALATCGALGVGLGAFGAHALKAVVEPRLLETWQTGVFYLMIHTLAGILLESHRPGKHLGLLMLIGNVLFSGSLFLLVLTGFTPLGAVTPFGGVVFIVAWMRAALLFFSTKARP